MGRKALYWAAAAAAMVLLFVADLLVGSTHIPATDVWKALSGKEVSGLTSTIVVDIRLSKALTALFSGIASSIEGYFAKRSSSEIPARSAQR